MKRSFHKKYITLLKKRTSNEAQNQKQLMLGLTNARRGADTALPKTYNYVGTKFSFSDTVSLTSSI